MTEGESLVDRVRGVLVDVEGVVKASEARLAYRREHGRSLSAAHKGQLTALLVALDGLRERLQAVLEPPPPDPAELRGDFERACANLDRLEGER